MKLVLRIIISLIILNLFLVGISFFIPGRLGFVDSYSIGVEKAVIGQMEKISSISVFRKDKSDPYSASALSFSELTPYLDTIQPGTLFFTDQGETVSALFISGPWKHCGIYIGSMSQIRQYWGWDHEIVKTLEKYYSSNKEYLIFDSSYKNGVAIHSIGEMADLSDISTLRKLLLFEYQLDKDKWSQLLLSNLEHLGKDYDYCFVLDNPDALYCSELLYNMLPQEQNNLIPSKKILGRAFLLPSDLVNYFLDKGKISGEFVCKGSISKGMGQITLSSGQ